MRNRTRRTLDTNSPLGRAFLMLLSAWTTVQMLRVFGMLRNSAAVNYVITALAVVTGAVPIAVLFAITKPPPER